MSETRKLHNRGKSTIYAALTEGNRKETYAFRPNTYAQFEDGVAEKLLKLYPETIVDLDKELQDSRNSPVAKASAAKTPKDNTKKDTEVTLTPAQKAAATKAANAAAKKADDKDDEGKDDDTFVIPAVEELEKLDVDQLKDIATKANIKFPNNADEDKLIELLTKKK